MADFASAASRLECEGEGEQDVADVAAGLPGCIDAHDEVVGYSLGNEVPKSKSKTFENSLSAGGEDRALCSDRGELLMTDIDGDGDSGLGINLASGREGKVAEDEEAPSYDQEHRLLSNVSS